MLLLDTHTFIGLASDRHRLSGKVIHLIRDDPAGLFISSITAVEFGLLSRAGKINTFGSASDFLFKNMRLFGIHEILTDSELVLASTRLPPLHRDPFDRVIIATAQKHGMTVLTQDRIISTYPKVKAVWE